MTDKLANRIDWKVPNLFRRYIDLCKEEVNAKNTSGGSLKKESWDKIIEILKEEFAEIKWSQKALKNKWDHLKKKYRVWYKLVGITGNTHYDPDTHTINWSTEQWSEYIKRNPDASTFQYKPLEYADEMGSLFDGMMAMGKIPFFSPDTGPRKTSAGWPPPAAADPGHPRHPHHRSVDPIHLSPPPSRSNSSPPPATAASARPI